MSPERRRAVPSGHRPDLVGLPAPGRLLGLDLGTRRIGVAVSDSAQTLALGVDTVARTSDVDRDRCHLVALVNEYEAVGVVVGLPLSLDGREGPAATSALAEVGALRRLMMVPVVAEDERLSTVTATSALRAGGRKTRQQRSVVDRTAAAVILQSWLDRNRLPAVRDRSEATGG